MKLARKHCTFFWILFIASSILTTGINFILSCVDSSPPERTQLVELPNIDALIVDYVNNHNMITDKNRPEWYAFLTNFASKKEFTILLGTLYVNLLEASVRR